MNESLTVLFNKETYKCDVCGSNYWRYLHEGDESNCECEGGECWRVCNEWNDGEGCDGVAELVEGVIKHA